MRPIGACIGPAMRVAAAPWKSLVWVLLFPAGTPNAAQFTIDGPAGSGEFGRTVTILPNGNIVVTDPGFDAPGPVVDVGAVYLYRPNGTLISALRGSTAGDRIGNWHVVVLANGNFVVASPFWDNDAIANAGAVTFGSGTSGITGVVSSANSLVGSTANDFVGFGTVTALATGAYVVASPEWDNSAVVDAGAVTFGSGTSGIAGAVSSANSLVGSTADDFVGKFGVKALANGNYLVLSLVWDNGAIADAGAITFGSGTSGISGVVSPVNSLVGSTANDVVGNGGVTALANGNYVVRSPDWDNGVVGNAGAATFGSGTSGISGVISAANSLVGNTGHGFVSNGGVTALTNGNYVVVSPEWGNGVSAVAAGAVTFGSGTSGISGVVSQANSLVGSRANDRVGNSGVVALKSGNYVVVSTNWSNGSIGYVGAVTLGSGTSGITGVISPANSLVGSTESDGVGNGGVAPLTNGNYVVGSWSWDNGAIIDAGAVTFGNGTSGITGVVSSTNSLVGSTEMDYVGGGGVMPLANGNYVVTIPEWDNGTILNAGAATFGSGTSGITGAVSSANSLVGSSAFDEVGRSGVTPLTNGNYVVRSPRWNNGAIAEVGAVTFGSGTSGITGVVSSANSLVGSAAFDNVGNGGVVRLTTGHYVVGSWSWDNGAIADAGAVTFGSGTSGIGGFVSAANSLVGSTAGDRLGYNSGFAQLRQLENGNYAVKSPFWDNGAISDAGAVTLGLFNGSVTGAIASTQSVLGMMTDDGYRFADSYDATRNQHVVGLPASNRVVLQRPGVATAVAIVSETPDPSEAGQPVTFTANVSASPDAPTNGQVIFTASSGESCVDTSPTPASATTATFACAIGFATVGTSTVIAEYTGSVSHAYSGSDPETHTTVAVVFADGFESP